MKRFLLVFGKVIFFSLAIFLLLGTGRMTWIRHDLRRNEGLTKEADIFNRWGYPELIPVHSYLVEQGVIKPETRLFLFGGSEIRSDQSSRSIAPSALNTVAFEEIPGVYKVYPRINISTSTGEVILPLPALRECTFETARSMEEAARIVKSETGKRISSVHLSVQPARPEDYNSYPSVKVLDYKNKGYQCAWTVETSVGTDNKSFEYKIWEDGTMTSSTMQWTN